MSWKSIIITLLIYMVLSVAWTALYVLDDKGIL